MTTINNDFLLELLKLTVTNRKVLEICAEYLKYQYLPEEAHKRVWKEIYNYYNIHGKSPTFGILGQNLQGYENETELLSQVKSTDVIGREEEVLQEFEKGYIKRARFIKMYNDTAELYNEGKYEEAYKLMAEESEAIHNFSIKQNYYGRIFHDFEKRYNERKQKEREKMVKVPFGIHELDWYTRGGGLKGTTACFLARSGVGKSTSLRHVGLSAATRGYNVAHIQLEGTEQEVYDAYDAAWTATDMEELELGNISKEQEQKIFKSLESIKAEEKDIHVASFEQFGQVTVNDVRDKLHEIEKNHGKIDLLIVDYMELLSVKGMKESGSEAGERRRRERVSEQLTNIATENDVLLITATQANDIKPEKWNNPDFVLTRSDISEFKGAIKPFSYFMTLNQTQDEYEKGEMRIYNDKFRRYRSGQTMKICQAMGSSRFYDSKKTLQKYWDNSRKKQINAE